MKKLGKQTITAVLGWQTRRLYKNRNFKVVAVAGSVGKTSTKLAIASTLSAKYKVQYQTGNYNDPISVPLIFFGHKMPHIFNLIAWFGIFIKNEKMLRSEYPFDVVVVELGTDIPGTMIQFKKSLKVDIGVLSAIAPEHMENFTDLYSVAEEEFTIKEYSSLLLVNSDMCDKKYLTTLGDKFISYGRSGDYKISDINFDSAGANFIVSKDSRRIIKASHESFAEPQLHSLLAAVAVSDMMGLSNKDIELGLKKIRPVAGRMQRLNGVKNSTIIDDSYNASPQAVLAALDTLYRLPAKHKIAVLGNMNELGKYSVEEHTKIGKYCDPRKLDLVVTIGPDANKYIASAAKKNGCKVESFDNPYAVGEYVKSRLENDTLVLVKGSQNKVYAEEAVKILLANPSDTDKLVRQSKNWMRVKAKNFS